MTGRLLPLIVLLAAVAAADASVLDNVGFTQLRDELGAALPAGRGLRVTQVESSVAIDHDANPDTPKVHTYRPDPTARGLETHRILVHGTAPGTVFSGHATSVAKMLVGRRPRQGMAGESELEVRSVSDWIGNDGLHAFSSRPPRASTSRVFNHSWVATLGGGDTRVLRRVDWLADRDEVIHVVGVRNAPDTPNQPLLAAAFNVIVVGRSDGRHSRGTPAVDRTYSADRTRPHVVVPHKTTSAATPVVAAAVLLLAETAASPALSIRNTATLTRGGLELRDAGRPEVLRAVLMATADRNANNRQYADIDDYRATPAMRTANGLDARYGAGQLNVYQAWRLLSAGEQQASDGPGARVATTGFDYAPRVDDTRPADYYFQTEASGKFSATLSWHLSFTGLAGSRFDASAELSDLDLCLYRLDADGETLVAASASTHEVTENLHLDLTPGRYRLEVRHNEPAGASRPDYGLAWQFRRAGAD